MFDRLHAGALVALVALGGCTASSRSYVEANSQGMVEVRGRIQEVNDLSTRGWENLTDGFAARVGKKGCTVKIAQSETRTATYELSPGDTVVWGGDFDFLITRLPQEIGAAGPAATGGDAAKAPQDGAAAGEDEAAGGD